MLVDAHELHEEVVVELLVVILLVPHDVVDNEIVVEHDVRLDEVDEVEHDELVVTQLVDETIMVELVDLVAVCEFHELQYGMLHDEVEVDVLVIVVHVVEVAELVIGWHDVMLLATEADEVEVDVRGLVLVAWLDEMVVSEYSI